MKRTFPFRVMTGLLLAAMLVIPLGVFLSSTRKQSAVIAEIGNLVEDAEGDWMVTVTLTNRSQRIVSLRGNTRDFLLHEIKSGDESLRYPQELDEYQTNQVLLGPRDGLTTQVFVPARMGGQAVRVGFHSDGQGYNHDSSFLARAGIWWDTFRWGKIAANQVIETAPFVPKDEAVAPK